MWPYDTTSDSLTGESNHSFPIVGAWWSASTCSHGIGLCQEVAQTAKGTHGECLRKDWLLNKKALVSHRGIGDERHVKRDWVKRSKEFGRVASKVSYRFGRVNPLRWLIHVSAEDAQQSLLEAKKTKTRDLSLLWKHSEIQWRPLGEIQVLCNRCNTVGSRDPVHSICYVYEFVVPVCMYIQTPSAQVWVTNTFGPWLIRAHVLVECDDQRWGQEHMLLGKGGTNLIL
jgi:hypothetical protein